MLAYTYIEQGKFELREKPIPEIQDSWDAIVRVTLGSICSSDLHIKHGSVPRAVPGITVGHEMVGVVEKVGADVIGAGPTGICTLLCVLLKKPRRIIVCEKSPERARFVRQRYPEVLVTDPKNCKEFVLRNSDHGGADVVLEVAGSEDTFRLAWDCARPNAIVTIVALYDKPQLLPLPDMYGKNLTFKTGGVDGCDCAEILNLIEEGKIDTTPLITHKFPLNEIEEAYRIFENRLDGVIKVAIEGNLIKPVFVLPHTL